VNTILQWNGSTSLAWTAPPASPRQGEVLLHATHTLLELHPEPRALVSIATVAEAGPGVELRPGSPVAVSSPTPGSFLSVDAASCTQIPAPAEPAAASVTPLLAEVLGALRCAKPDLGAEGVVAGSDLRAELLLRVLSLAGFRSVTSLRAADAPEPVGAVDKVVRGSAAGEGETLGERLKKLQGPVCAFDTTSQGSMIQALMSAAPDRSTIVLLAGHGSGASAVNFYRDVHRKNLRLLGVAAWSASADDLRRATRLLQEKRIELDLFRFGSVQASPGVPWQQRHRWVLLRWSGDPS
jgi:hypothetical protein